MNSKEAGADKYVCGEEQINVVLAAFEETQKSLRQSNNILDVPVESLDLSDRALNVLGMLGVRKITDLSGLTVTQLFKARGCGMKTVREITTAILKFLIAEKDSSFGGRLFAPATPSPGERRRSSIIFSEIPCHESDSFFYNMRLDQLEELPSAVKDRLAELGIKTVRDVARTPLISLLCERTISKKDLSDLHHSLLKAHARYCSYESVPANGSEAVASLLIGLSEMSAAAIAARHGLNGEPLSLQEAGRVVGRTRERVRQLVANGMFRLKYRTRSSCLEHLVSQTDRVLELHGGVIAPEDMYADSWFSLPSPVYARGLFGILADLFKQHYQILHGHFLSDLSSERLMQLQGTVKEAFERISFPAEERLVLSNLDEALYPLSKHYLRFCLVEILRPKMSSATVIAPRAASISRRLWLLLRDHWEPFGVDYATGLYRERYGAVEQCDRPARQERLRDVLWRSSFFVQVGPGLFMVRDHFPMPENMEQIVSACSRIISGLGGSTDIIYLLKALKRRRIAVDGLNPYSLKSLLIKLYGFVSMGRLEVGFKGQAKIEKKQLYADLAHAEIWRVRKPMTLNDILKNISTGRVVPRTSLMAILRKDERFLQLRPGVYTLSRLIRRRRTNK